MVVLRNLGLSDAAIADHLRREFQLTDEDIHAVLGWPEVPDPDPFATDEAR